MNFIPTPENSRLKIALRTKAVNASSTIVVRALRERGMHVNVTQYSLAINGNTRDKKADEIVEAADQLLTEWEQEVIKNYGAKALLLREAQ